MNAEGNFILNNITKAKLPRLAFARMKDAVLGPEYELSLNIVSRDEIHGLNKKYRQIDRPTDILSFPLSDTEGEIYINLEEAAKESVMFDREPDNFLGFLFIHGLVHLKGHDHSDKMEEEEIKYRKQFAI